jgi:hypothetical protein
MSGRMVRSVPASKCRGRSAMATAGWVKIVGINGP